MRRRFQGIADGRGQQSFGRDIGPLQFLPRHQRQPRPRRQVRHALVTSVGDAVHLLSGPAIVPVVADNTVLRRGAAGGDGSVACGRHRVRVGVMTIGEPGPLGTQTAETSRPVQLLPTLEVIAAHLVKDNQHGQPRRPLRRGGHFRRLDLMSTGGRKKSRQERQHAGQE